MKRVISGILFSFLLFFGSDAYAITSGSSASGTITMPTPATETFSGTSGQGIALTAIGDYTVEITVKRPDGTSMGTSSNRFFASSLTQTGTYTVELRFPVATPPNSGSYTLYYVGGGDSVSDGSLTSGSTASSTLPTNGLKSYQFSGTAGEGYMLNFAGDGFGGDIVVYKPDGSYWDGDPDRMSGTLPSTGTYTVVVYGTSVSASGDYDLYYVKGAGAVSSGSLTSGQSYSDTMPLNGLKSYQFSGTAGKAISIFVNSDSAYTAYIRVYKPDGSYWTFNTNRFQSTSLPATGTYTVVIYAQYPNQSGPYTLYYVHGAQAVADGELVSGQPYSSTLTANQLRSFTFEASAGQAFLLFMEASYTGIIYVYKPDGTYWTWTNTKRFTSTSLPSSGTYTILVYAGNITDTGNFNLYLSRGASTVSEGDLVTTKERQGTLPVNGLNSYVFEGIAGNSISITSSGGFSNRILYLFKPNGSYWTFGTNTFSSTLPAGTTGTWTLTVAGSSYALNGDYAVTVTTTAPTQPPTEADRSTMPKFCAQSLGGAIGGGVLVPGPSGGSRSGGGGFTPLPDRSGSGLPGPLSVAASSFTGNPLNFDVGYKEQIEVDYNADGLIFARIYRSDSTWTDNTVGEFWRHNYARSLSVSAGTSASITDGTGTTTDYSWSGSAWTPDDPSTTATFETISGAYKYTLQDGTVEIYDDSTLLLERVEYLGGGAVNLGYNGSSQLTSVTNENGRSISLTYSSGRVATVVTPDGTFSYVYDGNDNLSTVTRPDTEVRTYHYENGTYVNALTGITDEKGVRFATFGYDGSGKAISSQYAGGVNDYAVSYSTNSSTTTNPLGKDTVYHFRNILGVRRVVQVDGVASANCVASNRYYNYDKLGRVISKTDWENNTTRYQYDSRSNITKITEASGTPQQRVTTITWDSTFNLPDVIIEPNGLKTDYDYDVYGRMTTMTLTDTNTSETRITTYAYNSNTTDGSGNTILGRLSEINGPRTDVSDVTSFTYDGNLNLTKITNAAGHEIEITARDSAGRPTTIEDPNDVEIDLVYDSNGWLDTATQAPGTALEAVTDFDYDENGNLTQVTLPNGVTVQYTYDNAQRLTGIEDALGNTVTYTLNDAGNVTKTEYKNATPSLTYVHDATFDELARILTSVGAASQTASFAYDKNSNLTTYTDPKTNATGYGYDALQRLRTVTDALSGVTELGYDAQDNLDSVEDQRNNTTTYTYNAFGDVTGESSPDRGSISYVVDKAGNVTQRTDARSVVTDFTYDAINRLTAVEYPSDSSLDASLTYDASTGCGTAYKGRLCSVTDASGTTTYEYDLLGRVTEQEETRGGLTFTTAYTYDLAGNILTITLDSGRVITYTRNANGQASGVSAVVNSTGTTLASSITYLPFGPMNALTYGNSLTFSATFDQDYYLTNRTVSGGIYNHTYDTDANGNITQVGSTTFNYDALNRLEEEDSGSAVNYTYDATSNRLTKVNGGTTTTTVPSGSNKISAVGGDSYTYDAAGNITDDGTNEYTWNAAGQLGVVEVSSTPVGTYTYNVYNQRTKKVAGSTVHYVYGAGGLLYGEYDSSGDLIREYVYLNGEPLAQIDAGSPEVLTYLHTDHLGTPKFGTNSGGTQVWSWAPDAFGVGSPSGSVTINLRMPGQYFDSESGVFYNWNRYYNPAIGRYISSDPIGIAGGPNTFNYADVNPVNRLDPEGLMAAACTRNPRSLECVVWEGGGGGGAPSGGLPIVWPSIGQIGRAIVRMCTSDEATTDLEPPGDCTPEEHRDLQDRVDNACGAAFKCKVDDDIPTLSSKIGEHSRCIDARNRINKRCFRGGNPGHIDAVSQRLGAIRRCQRFISDFGKKDWK